MNGLTEEQQKRLSLITHLDDMQAKLLLGGILGALDAMLSYKFTSRTTAEVAEKIVDDIDTMIAKFYEKGMYS